MATDSGVVDGSTTDTDATDAEGNATGTTPVDGS